VNIHGPRHQPTGHYDAANIPALPTATFIDWVPINLIGMESSRERRGLVRFEPQALG